MLSPKSPSSPTALLRLLQTTSQVNHSDRKASVKVFFKGFQNKMRKDNAISTPFSAPIHASHTNKGLGLWSVHSKPAVRWGCLRKLIWPLAPLLKVLFPKGGR